MPAQKSASGSQSVTLPGEAELQLLFARLNYQHFNGEAPDCRIRYNERFANSTGRITYTARPFLIELSPKHFRKFPEALEETVLHEMIHAWCYYCFRHAGHGSQFRKKMRECGITSIHHDLGNVTAIAGSGKRYILRCAQCGFEALRRRLPGKPMSCARCNKRRFDPRFPLTIFEVIETKEVGDSLRRAANKGAP